MGHFENDLEVREMDLLPANNLDSAARQSPILCPHGLTVMTQPCQGCNPGSIPGGGVLYGK